ncbi:MAG: nucleotidyltransferase family protein [Candidatus Ranarchaeia archaeon]
MKLKIVIPAAGRGKRLKPHTNTKPKPLVQVAGKPILGHMLGRLISADVSEIIIVTGFMGDMLREYVENNFGDKLNFRFVTQEPQLGLGHAISVAAPYFDDEDAVLILLGDYILRDDINDWVSRAITLSCDLILAAKEEKHPERYGVLIVDDNGRVKNIIEKPKIPPSNTVITGIYLVKNLPLFHLALDWLMENKLSERGEYELTDALNWMIGKGSDLRIFPAPEWFDCGRKENILATNRVLLKDHGRIDSTPIRSVIIPPVAIGKDCHVIESIIGPNVSIAAGCEISKSIISDSIIGTNSAINNINIQNAMIGDDVEVNGGAQEFSIGDGSVLRYTEKD